MALVIKDRVKETTTTIGTGTLTLAGAANGYQSFAAIGNGNTTYYTIVGGSQWEVGIGTYTSSGTTLSRDTVLSSSTGSKINLAAGTKDVFVTYPSERAITGGGGGIGALVVNATTATENYTVDTGTNAQSVGPVTVASGVTITVSSGQRWLVV
jgi:hypothetical protein